MSNKYNTGGINKTHQAHVIDFDNKKIDKNTSYYVGMIICILLGIACLYSPYPPLQVWGNVVLFLGFLIITHMNKDMSNSTMQLIITKTGDPRNMNLVKQLELSKSYLENRFKHNAICYAISRGAKIQEEEILNKPCYYNKNAQVTVTCFAALYYSIQNKELLTAPCNLDITVTGLSLPKVHYSGNYTLSEEELNLPGYKGIAIKNKLKYLKIQIIHCIKE